MHLVILDFVNFWHFNSGNLHHFSAKYVVNSFNGLSNMYFFESFDVNVTWNLAVICYGKDLQRSSLTFQLFKLNHKGNHHSFLFRLSTFYKEQSRIIYCWKHCIPHLCIKSFSNILENHVLVFKSFGMSFCFFSIFINILRRHNLQFSWASLILMNCIFQIPCLLSFR